MTNQYRAGVSSSVQYAYEDSGVWGESADSMTASNETFVAFGQGVETTVSRSNNKVRNYGVGQRNAQSTSALRYSGTLTVNGAVNNFYWLLGALGSNTDGGSSPNYTHTYSEADSLPSFSCKRPIKFETEKYELFQGCISNNLTLTAAVEEVLRFSLECPFRYSDIQTGSTTVATDDSEVYTFAGGTIEVPDGTTIAAIQNFELTINNNAEMVPEVGSRFAAGYTAKQRNYDISMTVAISDFSLLSKFYDGSTGTAPGTGSGEIATMTLTFENGDGHSAVFTFAGLHLNEDSLNTNPNETIKEDVTGWCNSLTSVVYTNGTEIAPKEATNVA